MPFKAHESNKLKKQKEHHAISIDLNRVLTIFMVCLFYAQSSLAIGRIELSIENLLYPLVMVAHDETKPDDKTLQPEQRQLDLKHFLQYLI